MLIYQEKTKGKKHLEQMILVTTYYERKLYPKLKIIIE